MESDEPAMFSNPFSPLTPLSPLSSLEDDGEDGQQQQNPQQIVCVSLRKTCFFFNWHLIFQITWNEFSDFLWSLKYEPEMWPETFTDIIEIEDFGLIFFSYENKEFFSFF